MRPFHRELLREMPEGYTFVNRGVSAHPYALARPDGTIVRDENGRPITAAGTPGDRRAKKNWLVPRLLIVLDPEKEGLGVPYTGELIRLGDDVEFVVTGLPDGMAAGADGKKRASIAFAFPLPNGDLVIAETSWRLLSTAYHAFLGKFGEADLGGDFRIEMPDAKEGPRALEFVASEKPFVICGECARVGREWRRDAEGTKESVDQMIEELYRHYRKKHPRLPLPPIPEFPGLN